MTDVDPARARAETVTLGPAAADAFDAETVGALLLATDPHLFGYMHGQDEALAVRHLAHQWAQGAGLFSHAHAVVATQDGAGIGLELGFDAATQQQEGGPFAAAAAEALSEAEFATLLASLEYIGYAILPVSDDAYYLQNLAIVPEARGRGIGEKLLEDCFERARAAGHGRVLLDLYEGNPAQRLYERVGMAVVAEVRVLPMIPHGVGTHLRMEIKL